MLWPKVAIAVLSCATLMSAQSLPAGTALPISLGSGLNAKSDKAGQKIEGKLMQEVMLPSGNIKAGARVTGHVVSATKPGATGSRIVLQFDQMQSDHGVVPLNVSARAVASSANVFQAGIPVDSASSDEASNEWVTKQVGGDIVFRGRGYVASPHGKVGRWSGAGVWGRLTAAGDCADSVSNDAEQSLWIFSTSACGAYGLESVKLAHAGDTPPEGQIVLESTKDIEMRGASGWLLVVNAGPAKADGK